MIFIRLYVLLLWGIGCASIMACPSKREKELENVTLCNIEGVHVLGRLLAQLDGVYKKEPWGIMVKPSKSWSHERFSFVFIPKKINEKKLHTILSKAESFFGDAPFVVYFEKTNKHLVEAFDDETYEQLPYAPGGYIMLRPVQSELPPAVRIKRALNEEDGAMWARITAQVYKMDEEKLFAFFKEASKNQKVYFYIGYLDDQPVSSRLMLVYPHPKIKGQMVSTGYLSATLPKARRQGLAAALVKESFSDAVKEKAELFVTQSSLQGQIMWKKIGLKEEGNNYLCFRKKDKKNLSNNGG